MAKIRDEIRQILTRYNDPDTEQPQLDEIIIDDLVKLFERMTSEDLTLKDSEICVKCGRKFIPRLIKPLSICENCADDLSKRIDELAS